MIICFSIYFKNTAHTSDRKKITQNQRRKFCLTSVKGTCRYPLLLPRFYKLRSLAAGFFFTVMAKGLLNALARNQKSFTLIWYEWNRKQIINNLVFVNSSKSELKFSFRSTRNHIPCFSGVWKTSFFVISRHRSISDNIQHLRLFYRRIQFCVPGISWSGKEMNRTVKALFGACTPGDRDMWSIHHHLFQRPCQTLTIHFV